ncbi:unnamed protein product, partial [Brassica rapa subsp. narinosa]
SPRPSYRGAVCSSPLRRRWSHGSPASALSNSTSLSPLIFYPFKLSGFVRLLVLVGEHCDCFVFRGLPVYVLGFLFGSPPHAYRYVSCWAQICKNQLPFHRHRSCSCSHRLS